jgi:hypothetical protein
MERRVVVQILTLKNLSAKDITTELEGLYGHEVLSLSTVKKWRKRFVNRRITLVNDPQPGRPPRNDCCESLRTLTDETSFISFKRTCQTLRIPKTTCLRVSHEDLGFRKCYLRWFPHSMRENEAQCWFTFSEELVQVVRHAKETTS